MKKNPSSFDKKALPKNRKEKTKKDLNEKNHSQHQSKRTKLSQILLAKTFIFACSLEIRNSQVRLRVETSFISFPSPRSQKSSIIRTTRCSFIPRRGYYNSTGWLIVLRGCEYGL